MSTIRISRSRRGTTIRVKAGKGENLIGFVEMLAGKRPSETWISHAQWPLNVYRGMDGKGISTDTHKTKEEALSVCHGLLRDGFGGNGADFPLRTWVTKAGDAA